MKIMKQSITFSACLFLIHMCLGGLFSKTEMSEVLTEILKVDPSFDKDSFLKQCERDIIPNILEVYCTDRMCIYYIYSLVTFFYIHVVFFLRCCRR